jgi:hypothetical protein
VGIVRKSRRAVVRLASLELPLDPLLLVPFLNVARREILFPE